MKWIKNKQKLDKKDWHLWFAWKPVCVFEYPDGNVEKVWGETILRRFVYQPPQRPGMEGEWVVEYKYRPNPDPIVPKNYDVCGRDLRTGEYNGRNGNGYQPIEKSNVPDKPTPPPSIPSADGSFLSMQEKIWGNEPKNDLTSIPISPMTDDELEELTKKHVNPLDQIDVSDELWSAEETAEWEKEEEKLQNLPCEDCDKCGPECPTDKDAEDKDSEYWIPDRRQESVVDVSFVNEIEEFKDEPCPNCSGYPEKNFDGCICMDKENYRENVPKESLDMSLIIKEKPKHEIDTRWEVKHAKRNKTIM